MSDSNRNLSLLCSIILTLMASTHAGYVSYVNDFVDPDYIVSGDFGQNTLGAQSTIVNWAQQSSAGGPWSVVNKTVSPPSGDMHDYLSWAPYWWPDCSGVGNTSELTPQEVWTTCPYKNRDGQFNPDIHLINNIGDFDSLSDAVLYNTIAWSITKNDTFAESASNWIQTWFLNNATLMNPNLNYAQIQRGPGGTNGTHTGVLDLKCMVKIVSGILILRKSNSPTWTPVLDNDMNSWATQYVNWLETKDIALQEAASTNNHGTFYYNQLAALKILLGDFAGARNATDTYFQTIYMSQIVQGGEQPLEAARTRPYHYRAYNLAAMITNARLAEYANCSEPAWNDTTSQGATIKDALDFAMTISPGATGEDDHASELYPSIAAVASVYGDPDGKYAAFLTQAESNFSQEAYYLWNQPFAEMEELAVASESPSPSPSVSPSPSGVTASGNSSLAASTRQSTASRIGYDRLIPVILSAFVYVLI